MRQTNWFKYLPLFLIAFVASPVVNTLPCLAQPVRPAIIDRATKQFDTYMRLGYAATAKRDYRNALAYFKQAENIKNGNRFATQAINNVSRYIALQENQKRFWVAAGTGSPSNRIAGATRGQNCVASKESCLTSLLPETSGQLTTSVEYPAILFHITQTTAPEMEFRLVDSVERVIYTTIIPVPKQNSFIKVDFNTIKDSNGKKLSPLKIGREYKWDFSIVKDANDRSNNLTLSGTILRQEIDPNLAQMLQEATSSDRISIYAANDLWYDFVAALYDEQLRNPSDRQIASAWANLLEQIKLENIGLGYR